MVEIKNKKSSALRLSIAGVATRILPGETATISDDDYKLIKHIDDIEVVEEKQKPIKKKKETVEEE